ncbi:acyltransferase family protein [Cohnella luojiensis]|uniref:Acyltransferase n=1 Tax=Cohnella luojiensis TaxID=652876 RepID=A0A4Y8LQ31_9BACL|nr:acyltransferase [Cohnella luojiensis]TFE22646.1 acyltransferase [Cohnella luojiensis]
MKNRIPQLDSIRGLASLSVFLHHIYLATPILPIIFWQSPLRIFINGRGAVLLFFVLSGLVLSLPFFNGKPIPYFTFLIKRVFRIYIPYVISIFVAIAACSFFSTDIKFDNSWPDGFWKVNPNINSILEHMNLVGNIHTEYFNTVIWSLIHEMRISLVFPFILIVVSRLNLLSNLMLCISLSLIAGLNDIIGFQHQNGFNTSYFDSLHYLSVFVIGALLSKHKKDITIVYKKISTKTKWTLLGGSLFMYTYSAAIYSFLDIPFNDKVADYGITLAAAAIIVVSINSVKLANLLTNKPIMFLGKISFSLYLYHMTVLLSSYNILYDAV